MTRHTQYDGTITEPELDDQDRATIAARASAYDKIDGPRVGDFIEYADGMTRRIAHLWPADWHDDKIARVQPTDGGSFYLGGIGESAWHRAQNDGQDTDAAAYVSYSGALYPGIRANTLTLTGSRNGRVWVFHHEQWDAGMGVDDEIAFRVYRSTLDGRDPWNADSR